MCCSIPVTGQSRFRRDEEGRRRRKGNVALAKGRGQEKARWSIGWRFGGVEEVVSLWHDQTFRIALAAEAVCRTAQSVVQRCFGEDVSGTRGRYKQSPRESGLEEMRAGGEKINAVLLLGEGTFRDTLLFP